jgi:hypothetical protein
MLKINVATKEHRRKARGLIEQLEVRVHSGPPVLESEIRSALAFLQQSEFSPESDYFNRLNQVKCRLYQRWQAPSPAAVPRKCNYGGEAAGRWMQLQSAYDHIILSTCYDGDYNLGRGRIKISHRFNREGRVDFVELKFLRSLQPCLTGAYRKLVLVRDYQDLRKDWCEAEAFVLEVMPRELVFLFKDIFHSPRVEMVAWLVNIGHRLASDLLTAMDTGSVNGYDAEPPRNADQLHLDAAHHDAVAMPILEQAASLESVVESLNSKTVILRYAHRSGI